ncbi:MAG TPA: hypothetical protein VLE53_13655 [Gemmatimonadaceae bacterium]|nr:hypothetical protein [Gemmatimonadaceae bacterium]
MFGCLGRLGCLVLLLLAAVAFLTRDRWASRIFGDRGTTTVVWQPVTDSGAIRAGEAVESLSRGSGPAYVTLTAAELASLIASRAVGGLPSSVDSVQAAIEEDRVRLRARINLEHIRGLDDLGPLANLLNRRERFEASGTLDIVRPGLAQFLVTSAQIGDLPIPTGMIPRVLERLSPAPRPEGVAESGIPFQVPESIGDVRVARGRVTLYKRTP